MFCVLFVVGTGSGLHRLHTADPVIDLFFFLGPRLPDVMAQFTSIYGRTSMPPKWALGLHFHPVSSLNQTMVAQTISDFAAANLTLSVLTLEPKWQVRR